MLLNGIKLTFTNNAAAIEFAAAFEAAHGDSAENVLACIGCTGGVWYCEGIEISEIAANVIAESCSPKSVRVERFYATSEGI